MSVQLIVYFSSSDAPLALRRLSYRTPLLAVTRRTSQIFARHENVRFLFVCLDTRYDTRKWYYFLYEMCYLSKKSHIILYQKNILSINVCVEKLTHKYFRWVHIACNDSTNLENIIFKIMASCYYIIAVYYLFKYSFITINLYSFKFAYNILQQ